MRAMTFSNLIAMYLFLGGASAGTFTLLSFGELRFAFSAHRKRFSLSSRERAERRGKKIALNATSKTGYALALAMLVVGLLCLVADLGRPQEVLLLFTNPTGSLITLGTFALTALTVCLTLALAKAALEVGTFFSKAAIVAKIVGLPVAITVMIYTGMLLKNTLAVNLWQSVWLPVLFLLSSLSCGAAVVLLSMCFAAEESDKRAIERGMRDIAIFDVAVIALEALVTVAFALSTGGTDPHGAFCQFASGSQALSFWLGFVGCALVVPVVIEISSVALGRFSNREIAAATALMVLTGSVCLRFSLIAAGVQPALQ